MSVATSGLDRMQRRSGAVLLVGVIVLLMALGARLVYINASLSPRLVAMAQRQQSGRSVVPARRGMILDSRGRVMALSRLIPDVFVDPALVKDIDALAGALSARLNQSKSRIAQKIRRYRPDPNGPALSRFVVLAEQVDPITADAIRSMRHPAVGLKDRAHRAYPQAQTTAKVLGWVGRDGTGLEGIELAYDAQERNNSFCQRRTYLSDHALSHCVA